MQCNKIKFSCKDINEIILKTYSLVKNDINNLQVEKTYKRF